MDGITVKEIRDASPYKNTLVAICVNGNAKSMPHKESYTLLHRAALNSPFVPGSAELTRDTAEKLLNDLKNGE
jgi:hypothetical protein